VCTRLERTDSTVKLSRPRSGLRFPTASKGGGGRGGGGIVLYSRDLESVCVFSAWLYETVMDY
jgi:hypothetical protein